MSLLRLSGLVALMVFAVGCNLKPEISFKTVKGDFKAPIKDFVLVISGPERAQKITSKISSAVQEGLKASNVSIHLFNDSNEPTLTISPLADFAQKHSIHNAMMYTIVLVESNGTNIGVVNCECTIVSMSSQKVIWKASFTTDSRKFFTATEDAFPKELSSKLIAALRNDGLI